MVSVQLGTGAHVLTNIRSQQSAERDRGRATRTLRGAELGKTAFYLAYSRPPTKEEGTATLAYFENFQNTARESGMGQDEARNLALSTFCQTLLSSAEFRYVD